MNIASPYVRWPLALAFVAAAGLASAQSNDSSGASGASNPAVNAKNTASANNFVAPSALQKGSNSFTEGEAKSRLESAGLANVADLKKDDSGIWRGKAQHDGKSVSVGLDYKGAMSAE